MAITLDLVNFVDRVGLMDDRLKSCAAPARGLLRGAENVFLYRRELENICINEDASYRF